MAAASGRVFRVLQLMQLQRECALPFEIRPSHVNFRPRYFAFVNGALELQVRVWFDASGGSNRSYAAGQIQARKARGMLGIQCRRTIWRGVEHVIVHADDPGKDGIARQIEYFGAVRKFRDTRIAECADFTVTNKESLIGARGSARAIYASDMDKRNHRRIFLYKRAHLRRKGRFRLRAGKARQKQVKQNEESNFSHQITRRTEVSIVRSLCIGEYPRKSRPIFGGLHSVCGDFLHER